jgi:metal-sulfur cluster biosynthetic enzyme
MNEEAKTSILQMARGAIQERIDYEMAKVIDNILDPNTSTQKKRKLTLTIELHPDDNRQTVFVNCTAKSALCPTNPVSTSLYITGDGATGEVVAVEMVPNVPGQQDMFGEEQEAAPILKMVRNA